MVGRWIVFGMIGCLTVILAILYPNYTMALLVTALLCYPVVAWAELLLHRFFLSVTSVEVVDYQLQIKWRNDSLIPVFRLLEDYQVRNCMTGEVMKSRFRSGLNPFETSSKEIRIEMQHYGVYELTSGRIRIRDAFGLLSVSKKLKRKELFLYSPLVTRSFEDRKENADEIQAEDIPLPEYLNTLADQRQGEEIPETQEVREYVQGDRQNRIHHRLTAKYDKIMVRVLEKAEQPELLLVPCLESEAYKANDRCLEYLTSLAEICLDRGIRADVMLPESVTGLQREKEDLTATLYTEAELEDVLYQILSVSCAGNAGSWQEDRKKRILDLAGESYALIAWVRDEGITWQMRGGEELS